MKINFKCYLIGGLGNQIFQNVVINWIKNNTRKNIIISKADYLLYKNIIRKFRKIQSLEYYEWVNDEGDIGNDLMLISRFKSRFFDKHKIITDKFFYNHLKNKKKFFKYLRKAKYLKSHCIFPQLINYEEFNESWNKISKSFYKEIKRKKIKSENYFDIVIHIRRGDYLSFPGIYKQLSEDYFYNAIHLIKERKNIYGKPKCLIIGNDINWAKEIFSHSIKGTFQYKNIIEDFTNLVFSENLIISNSSFSMSAAMIGMCINKNKLIVCPKNYYENDKKICNLYHNNWLLIDN